MSPQIYLSAFGLLAELATRLPVSDAEALLEMLSDSVVVEEHRYRRTDGSHIQIAAGIARTHTGDTRATALKQLVGLFERRAHPFRASARETLIANLDEIRDRLREMADGGHRDAAALLGYAEPEHISPEAAQAAAERLREPTDNGPTKIGVGTGAVSDSLLAAVLPAVVRIACIDTLIANAGSPWEPATNRDDYLIAASNLTDDLDETYRSQLLCRALNFAIDPPPSQADAFNASMSSPLSSFRIHDRTDCRPAATFLAARLAKSQNEKQLVRDTALRLVGVGADEDYRIAKALHLVQSEVGNSIRVLAQGSWTLRSLAAVLWADSDDVPDDVGVAFSQDRDVRVRRALASAMVASKGRRTSNVRELLLRDPRWSVRSFLQPSAPL